MRIFLDSKKRKHGYPACGHSVKIGGLEAKRKAAFLKTVDDLSQDMPDLPPASTDDDDCMICGWPVYDHVTLN
jgi:hypothetical protein